MNSEPLVKLKPMNGFMHGFFSKFTKLIIGLLIGLLISTAISYFAAHKTQSTYRNYLNFSGEKTEIQTAADLLDEQVNSTTNSGSTNKSLDNKYLDSALNFAVDAKDWTASQLQDNPLAGAYDKVNQDYFNLRYKLLKIGDLISFWLSFILTFIVSTFALNKLGQIKQILTQETDPSVEENIKRLAKAVNDLDKRTSKNQTAQNISNPQSPPLTNTNPINPNPHG